MAEATITSSTMPYKRQRPSDREFRRLIRNAHKFAMIADAENNGGLVYFIAPMGGGPVKIGFTRDPSTRFKALQNTSPHQLELVACAPGDEWLESIYHGAFCDARLHGEWFEPTYRLKKECERLASLWIG